MSFPASLTIRKVTGRFVTYPDGIAAKGSVRIVLEEFMQGPTDDLFVAPFDILVSLDVDGAFAVYLPATDDPQWTPSRYKVVVTANGKQLMRRIGIPYDSTNDLDLSDIINILPPTPGESYILLSARGAPDGVASLGSDGKVPAGQLPPGNGGATTWTDIVGKPSTFPPTAHTHAETDITGLVTALAGKADAPVTWDSVTGKPDITPGGVALVWDGSQYVLSTATTYIGPVDPVTVGTPALGSVWYVTNDPIESGGGSLLPGQRVTTIDQVGYLGAAHDSTRTLHVGDTIPSELSGCVWDETVLRVNAGNNNMVIDGWTIYAGIDCYSADLTVINCILQPGEATTYYGVLGRAGNLTVQDTTIIGAGGVGESGQCISLDSTGSLTIERCDLSGFQDAIGIEQGLISQCYIHDSALAGSFHSDGIQIFGGGTTGTTIEHSLIDITGPAGASTDGEHQNACIYTDAPSGPAHGVTVNNCQLNGGVYELMLAAAPQGVSVTNCDFGPVDSTGYGTVTADPGTQILTWTNNHDSSHDLISNPML